MKPPYVIGQIFSKENNIPFLLFANEKLIVSTGYTFQSAYFIIQIVPDFHLSLQKIPIFTQTYALYKLFYEYLPSFPRTDRYTLGQKCETILLEILEAVILASTLPKQDKLPILKQASRKIDVLKVLFSLGQDLKVIDNTKYAVLDAALNEIGKMFGGWIRASSDDSKYILKKD